MDKATEQAVDDYLKNLPIPDNIKNLINQANWDLYYGPIQDDPAYPGYISACAQISDALDEVGLYDIYVEDWSGCVLTSLPEPYEDEDGEIIEPDYSEIYLINRRELKQRLLGSELAANVP